MYWYNAFVTPVQYTGRARTAKGISAELEQAIHDGVLSPDEPLPGVRVLSEERGVAPGTVASAYRTLQIRGLVESRGRRGTFVRPKAGATGRFSAVSVGPDVTDLSRGQPDPALLPVLPWSASLTRHRRAAPPTELMLPDLVVQAHRRLADDGVPPGPLTVSSGTTDAIHRVLAARLRPGDTVGVEDPGWPNLLDLVAGLGMRARPLLVDEDGPRPDHLLDVCRAGVAAVVVTPRGHNPTGARVSARRAQDLRRVLAGYPAVLTVEDDHSADLIGGELALVAGATQAWVYARSTSKTYGPDLRLAVVTGDDRTVSGLSESMRTTAGWVSTLLQRLVVDLWASEKTSAAVASAYREYTDRRHLLGAALAERGVLSTGASGIHLWIPVVDETTAVAQLLHDSWLVSAGANFRQVSPPAIRVTVSGVRRAAVRRLAADIARARAGAPIGRYTT